MPCFLGSPLFLSVEEFALRKLNLFSTYAQMKSYLQKLLRISHNVGDVDSIVGIG